jgi:hypothetical protein
MEKEFNTDKYLEPNVYAKGTEEYTELSSLEGIEWGEFLDELASHGLTCNYSNVNDTYTIG